MVITSLSSFVLATVYRIQSPVLLPSIWDDLKIDQNNVLLSNEMTDIRLDWMDCKKKVKTPDIL